MTRAERRAAEQARWSRQQAEERAHLAGLLATVESVPVTWNRRASVYGCIKGLRWRIEDRQARLDGMAAERAREAEQQAALASGLVGFLGEHGGRWEGTAGDLLALLPGAAHDATRLAKRLAGDDVAAAGILIERRRDAGTGRRVLLLDLRKRESQTTPIGCDATAPMLVNDGIPDNEGFRPDDGAAVAPPPGGDADPLAVIYGTALAAVMRRRR
jgi:hypothetical protein